MSEGNAELIAEARESLAQHDRTWANTSNRPLTQAGVSAHLRKIIPALEAAQAIIAEVDEYLDAIQVPDYLSLQFAINGIFETLHPPRDHVHENASQDQRDARPACTILRARNPDTDPAQCDRPRCADLWRE